VSVTADKKPRKVTIAVLELSVQLHYTAIPSLAEKAYLRAKAKNTSKFQLLPGPMNVFNDNVFVANSQLGVSDTQTIVQNRLLLILALSPRVPMKILMCSWALIPTSKWTSNPCARLLQQAE